MNHHPGFSLGRIDFMQMGVHPAHHQINQLVEAVETVIIRYLKWSPDRWLAVEEGNFE